MPLRLEPDRRGEPADADIVVAHSLTSEVPAGSEGLRSTVLVREPLDVALPPDHPLAGRARLRPQDVVDEGWIAVPEGYPFDTVLQRIEAECGRPATRRLRMRDNQLIAALVASGEGIALLPRFTTRTDLMHEREKGVRSCMKGTMASTWLSKSKA